MIKKIFKKKILIFVATIGILSCLAVVLIKISIPAFADDISPVYPSRIKPVITELNEASQNLIVFNEDLVGLTGECSCQNTASQCQRSGLAGAESASPEAVGDICPKREEMGNVEQNISNEADKISYLRNLLITEMNGGLEDDLKTLPTDEAKTIRDQLNKILDQSQKLIASSQKNSKILNDQTYSAENKCKASCSQGSTSLEIKACAFGSIGEQDPIELKFEVGGGLKNLNLGDMNIGELKLNLPDKIQFLNAGKIPDFEIPLPDINIGAEAILLKNVSNFSFPSIVFHPSSPSLPDFPQAGFSCPAPQSQKPYQCPASQKGNDSYYSELEWYLETTSWLSEQCQGITTMTGKEGVPTDKMSECFDEQNVHLTILQECDSLWKTYFQCAILGPAICPKPSGICGLIKDQGNRGTAVETQCRDLFNQLGESTPQSCDLTALKNKCDQLEKSGDTETPPEPCEYLPLFTKTLNAPKEQDYQGPSNSCPSQTISSSSNNLSLTCPDAGFSAGAKITLPGLSIPSLRLPTFQFMPFIKVKLPSFIFESLKPQEINLCDINQCDFATSGNFALNVQPPILRIPSLSVPSVYANIPGIPGLSVNKKVEIKLDRIDFPPIPISLPKFDLANYISLNMKMPEIKMPGIDFYARFSGLNINLTNLLLGLISSFVSMPGGCLTFSAEAPIPLIISFPDFYFYWPKFPEIPNACQGVNDFCQKIKSSLNFDLGNQAQKIQDVINNAIQKNVQARLDKVSAAYQEAVQAAVLDRLNEIKTELETGYNNVISKATIQNGYLNLGSFQMSGEKIVIPMNSVNDLLSKMPTDIPINWPEDLKTIKLTNPISYALPEIPLDGLNYSKEVTIKIPGFQSPYFGFSLSFLAEFIDYNSSNPGGGNPYPIGDLQKNTNEIKNIDNEINDSTDAINNVLQ